MVAGSVLYLASLAIANVLSIAITIFITYKIVKVSNGYSLFDPDASFGIKIRKYYMISIALSCFLRFIGTVVEFSVVALVALTYDSKDLDSWLMLHQDNFLLVVWISRTVPSISFIMTFAILVYYLASLRASLYGIESNSLWYWTISIHSLVLIGTIILLIFSEMTPLSSLLLAFYVIYFSLTVWFSVKIVRYFSSSGMPLPSRRIIERFSILVILSLMTMFFGGVYRVFQIEIIVTPR